MHLIMRIIYIPRTVTKNTVKGNCAKYGNARMELYGKKPSDLASLRKEFTCIGEKISG